MSQRVHLDANVILRFLRNDDPVQSPIAAALFTHAQSGNVELMLSPVTLAEVFYVLASAYGLPRPEVAKILQTFLSSGLASCEDRGVAEEALQRITTKKDSFGDAYLVATAAQAHENLATFDKGITSRKDLRVYPLASLIKTRSQ